MGEGLSILVYGHSVLLTGILVKLLENPDLSLASVSTQCQELLELVNTHGASALLFDLTQAPLDFALPLLRQRPGLVLIGLDPSRDEVLVVVGHSREAGQAADILTAIRQSLGTLPSRSTGSFSPLQQTEGGMIR